MIALRAAGWKGPHPVTSLTDPLALGMLILRKFYHFLPAC